MVASGRAPRTVTILGATGSIGRSTCAVLQAERDRFEVDAVTANGNAVELAGLAREVGAKLAVVADPDAYDALREHLQGSGIAAAAGPAEVVRAAAHGSDVTVAAIVGAAGLEPTHAAVAAGGTVALANKECLVAAGDVFTAAAATSGARLLPVDSEHNAIFQLIDGQSTDAVVEVTLTASGGPFRTWPLERMAAATRADALQHPNWSMGHKITVDSATLMNKGLELIEAHYLFGFEPHRLAAIVHAESIVHGLVEFRDGTVLAALGAPDMRLPIAHCLAWPERPASTPVRLDLAAAGGLSFEPVDTERFPAFAVARQALEAGGWATNILNAANEVAVAAFMAERIGFLGIAGLVADTLDKAAATQRGSPTTIAEAVALDADGRRLANEVLDAGTASAHAAG